MLDGHQLLSFGRSWLSFFYSLPHPVSLKRSIFLGNAKSEYINHIVHLNLSAQTGHVIVALTYYLFQGNYVLTVLIYVTVY